MPEERTLSSPRVQTAKTNYRGNDSTSTAASSHSHQITIRIKSAFAADMAGVVRKDNPSRGRRSIQLSYGREIAECRPVYGRERDVGRGDRPGVQGGRAKGE